MSTAPLVLDGPHGRAEETCWRRVIAQEGLVQPDLTATIGQFLLHLSGQHAWWQWWLLSAIHLRPIAGVRPAHLWEPDATHEFMLLALGPRVLEAATMTIVGKPTAEWATWKPVADEPATWLVGSTLHAPYQYQLAGLKDYHVSDLLMTFAEQLIHGRLMAEPTGTAQAREVAERWLRERLALDGGRLITTARAPAVYHVEIRDGEQLR